MIPDHLSPADAAVFEAESELGIQYMAFCVLRSLSDEQLRAIKWVGLLDDGWDRVFAELADRGIDL